MEALNHAVGAILLLKQLEYRPNSALHFLVWIENNLVAVVHKPNWYREAQLPLLRLVEFCSVEARANDVEFRLCELPFYTKYKTVVEVGWIVTTVAVEQCNALHYSTNVKHSEMWSDPPPLRRWPWD